LIVYFWAKKRYRQEYIPTKNTLNGLKKLVPESKAEEASMQHACMRGAAPKKPCQQNKVGNREKERALYML